MLNTGDVLNIGYALAVDLGYNGVCMRQFFHFDQRRKNYFFSEYSEYMKETRPKSFYPPKKIIDHQNEQFFYNISI